MRLATYRCAKDDMFALLILLLGFVAKIIDAQQSICNTRPSGEEGTLSSKNYPNKLEPYEYCRWIIEVPKGKMIKLTFDSLFDLKKINNLCFDSIEVFRGVNSKGKKIGEYCGKIAPSPILVEYNTVYILFKSNAVFLGEHGFRLKWKAVEFIENSWKKCASAKNQNGEYGSISSLNFPNAYESKSLCTWLITAQNSQNIKLTFDPIFDLTKYGSQCPDYVEVIRGSNSDGEKIGKFCGNMAPAPILIKGDRAFITFQSNSSTQGRGFRILWNAEETVDGQKRNGISPINRFGEEGSISSPNYPNNYPNSVNCSWLIRVPDNKRILLTFDDEFELEKGVESGKCYDYVEVYSNRIYTKLGPYCGETAPEPIYVYNNYVYVNFKSDSAIPFKGFKIDWRAY